MRITNNANGYIPAGALQYKVSTASGYTTLGSAIPQGGSIIVDVTGAGPGSTIILSDGVNTNATTC